MSLLTVEGLTVSFGPQRVVRDLSFTLDAGQCLAVVGESGSGKSVTARTLVGLAGHGAHVAARRLEFAGRDLTALREREWRGLRGRRIGLVLQDALVSLDPLRTVGAEVAEPLRVHGTVPRPLVPQRVQELLADAGVPEPAWRASQFPHQLSGGLRQRALIASALAARPELLIADEPTTALDVTVQAQILDLFAGLRDAGTALVLISHDLSVVARLADHVAVMHAGRLVETGPAEQVLNRPRHPYTRSLLDAVPGAHAKGARLSAPPGTGLPPGPDGCSYAASCPRADDDCRTFLPSRDALGSLCHHPLSQAAAATYARPVAVTVATDPAPPPTAAPLLEVVSVGKRYRRADGADHHAVHDVSFQVAPGETLGVVGESGSGKTTVARIALGLVEPDSGSVRFGGDRWSGLSERQRRPRRLRVQAVQQDPLGSFDPRWDVERLIGEPLARTGAPRGRARREQVGELLHRVGLAPELMRRRPIELSGGQRQRVAIARALAPEPDLIVADEPVSALDASVQAQILDLLADLQRELGTALLFISHDLGVIRHISDRVVVMQGGRVVEAGAAEEVFTAPTHPYAKELLAARSGGGAR
ncbi:ABC transporter ATP-binding protein [Streptacidiphilus jiangxiensis]|uniref:Peptide/nickel transport system ATP-binding protein n=1 Tax=Streptacidiphilus jiangxiensis TaxID=235985 RepID=A0A1H7TC39_STRJI|nr:ABC transporter ATP-binding protein [Streptacidiphilus jiangxiensis]SEL82430.1 peptide/nickel transport system ATP-binding protein [Streptacidiphilus jiangxiensis]